jgi:hypothetical protein
MNSNLDKIAQDLYGKIETRFTDIKIGDENAEVLSKKTDIPHARFFEFEYKHEGVPLGTIAITLDEDDGVVVQMSGNLAEKKHQAVFNFIRGLRSFAKDRLLNFDVQNIGKDNLDKRDYEFQAKPKEDVMMESKLYGTNRISYQDLGEARLIVKHTQPVNLELPAGRTMHIDSIYIENAQGERFRYPYKHLNGARALAEHIKAGGNPYDSIGKHITSLSEELTQLRKFKGYVTRNEALSEAMGDITTKVMERIDVVKKEVQMLQRPAYYESFVEAFEAHEEQMIPEEIMSDWIDRLTIRTFNEELKTAFPYIFRLVDESEIPVKELSADDILGELRSEEKNEKGEVVRWKEEGEWTPVKKEKNGRDKVTNLSDKARRETEKLTKKESIEQRFELAIARILGEDEESQDGHNTLFSKDVSVRTQAIENLKDVLNNEMLTVDTAPAELKSLLPVDQFQEYLEDQNPEAGKDVVKGLVVNYLNDLADNKIDNPMIGPNASDIASMVIDQIKLTDIEDSEPAATAAPIPAPVPAPAPAPAPVEAPPEMAAPAPAAMPGDMPPEMAAPAPAAMPMAENIGTPNAKVIKAIHRAKELGAKLETKLDFGSREITLLSAIRECGMSPTDFGFDDEESHNGTEEILQSISGFWNKEERNFTIGGTRTKIKVTKSFKNGEYKNAEEDDVRQVIKLIDKLDPGTDTGELGHIKKLAGVHDHAVDEEQVNLDAMINQFKLLANDPEAQQQLGQQLKQKFQTDIAPQMQQQAPNQTIQFPGGQMNPQEMMKAIMQKISQGN